MSRMRLAATCVASYVLVWIGALLAAFGNALAIDTTGQDTGDLGPFIGGFVIGAVVLNVAWTLLVSVWISRYGHVIRALAGSIVTPVAVIAALFAWLPLGVALGLALPAATGWWSSDPHR